MTTTSKQRRTRRLIIASLIGGALVTAVSAWAFYARWSFGGRLEKIRAAGDPVSLADLAPKPIPVSEDAAAQLASVNSSIGAFTKEHGNFFKTPVGLAYDQSRDRNEPAREEQIAAIKAILDKYSDLDAAIERATACPHYASRLDYSLDFAQFQAAQLDASADIRTIARFLLWQAEVAIYEGRPEDAVNKCLQVLRLAKLYESEPLVVNFLVAEAIRNSAAEPLYDALSLNGVSPKLHDELDRELARQDDSLRLVRALKQERAYSIAALDAQGSSMSPMVTNMIGWPIKLMRSGVLDYYDSLLRVMARPWHDVQADPTAKRVFQTPTGFGTLTDLLIPAIQAAYEAANRTTAVMRCLRIYNALRKYAAENDREAQGLSDLNLPTDAPIDPFSGAPLILKHTRDGWLIYSVGRDGKDDGGVLKDLKDCGVGPPK